MEEDNEIIGFSQVDEFMTDASEFSESLGEGHHDEEELATESQLADRDEFVEEGFLGTENRAIYTEGGELDESLEEPDWGAMDMPDDL